MGEFVTRADLSKKLYDGIYAMLCHRLVGLAQATVGSCAMFGSSIRVCVTASLANT
ncbi:MAG: hypothetical protein AAF636_14135 [Pseudomonadota bacterium]